MPEDNKPAAPETEMVKRRREAVLAMEGEQHRARRETQEALTSRQNAAEKANQEAIARAQAEAQARAARAEAERAQREEAALTAETERRRQIENNESQVGALKDRPTTLNPVRTIKTDMARAVRDDGLSLSRIATLGGRGGVKGEIIAAAAGAGATRRWLVPLALGLVLASSGGLIYWWWQGRPAPAAENLTPTTNANSPLKTDHELALSADAPASVRARREALDQAVKQPDQNGGGLINIYFYRQNTALTFKDFASTLGLTLPDNLLRYLRDTFVFGVYDNGETRSRFLLLQTNFFDQVWSALLDWERYLPTDLAPLLANPATKAGVWSDQIIKNKDVRTVKDGAGNPVLIYGFLNDQNILITADQTTFAKVFDRLIEQN